MRLADDFQEIDHILELYKEVIVLPFDSEGYNFLDLLNYTGFIHRICCIAKIVEGGGWRP